MADTHLGRLLERASREFLPVECQQRIAAVIEEYLALPLTALRAHQLAFTCRACERAGIEQRFEGLADLVSHRWGECAAARAELLPAPATTCGDAPVRLVRSQRAA